MSLTFLWLITYGVFDLTGHIGCTHPSIRYFSFALSLVSSPRIMHVHMPDVTLFKVLLSSSCLFLPYIYCEPDFGTRLGWGSLASPLCFTCLCFACIEMELGCLVGSLYIFRAALLALSFGTIIGKATVIPFLSGHSGELLCTTINGLHISSTRPLASPKQYHKRCRAKRSCPVAKAR